MVEARRVYAGPLIEPGAAGLSSEAGTARPERPDLVVVGAASRDLTDHDSRGWRLGGAATYCSLTAARLGLRVGCLLGVDDPASSAGELDLLRLAGVQVLLVSLRHGPVFENIEVDGHRRQRWHSESDPLPVSALPAEWRGAGGWLLAPVAGELPDGWAGVAAASARVALGWQGLLRDFGANGWVEQKGPVASRLARRAGLVCTSVDDLRSDCDLDELRRVATAATIVLTAGDGGGMALEGRHLARYAAFAAEAVADPTGAGDVFLSALMAAWLTTGELATSRTLRFAAAAGSLAVEGVGLAGVPTKAGVAARLAGGAAPPGPGVARRGGGAA